ncbi:hypothetical protein ES703_44403 [subsurface metagenome]
MPEINYTPYENAESLNKYIYDEYYSTEQLNLTVTNTGYLRKHIFELSQETGVTENSICLTNYNLSYFNPLYAEAIWKCYMNNADDSFVFFGFKKTLAEPTFAMIESHAGFMVNEGKLYASVADGDTQQKVEIIGVDLTRVQNYKIQYNKFSVMPLPKIEVALGLPKVLSVDRVWKLQTTLSNFPPENQVHYIVQYIKNFVGADKRIIFNRFIYKEVYAD